MLLRTTTLLAGLLGIMTLGGCDSTTDPPLQPVTWTAELIAENGSELAGSLTLESTATMFVAEIEVEEAAEGGAYAWYVGEGATCGEAEDRIGDAEDYPELELDANGAGSAEATVTASLDSDESYHVAVLSSDEDPVVVACGELATD